MKKTRSIILGALMFLPLLAMGQDVVLKTNLLGDALLNPNAGVEFAVAPRWTVDIPASFNAWNLSHDRRWKHWAVQPGARYWGA